MSGVSSGKLAAGRREKAPAPKVPAATA